MDHASAIVSQYEAALAMLAQAVERCPDSLWLAPEGPAPFWRVAYHALFYTQLYLANDEDSFRPWSQHRAEANVLGALPWPPFRMACPCQPYTRGEVLKYVGVCRQQVAERVPALDLAAGSGFDWVPFGKFELQIYSIRHLQHHAADLQAALAAAGIECSWVGSGVDVAAGPDPTT